MQELNHVSETAHWVACYRALEADTALPLFIDPYAKSLAGELGFNFLKNLPFAQVLSSLFVVRTKVIDEIITELLTNSNIKVVINLGAGLDTRPYRLSIPTTIQWIEIDQHSILEFKNKTLSKHQAFCPIKHVGIDHFNPIQLKNLLDLELDDNSDVLFITEGVLPYLNQEEILQTIHLISNTKGIRIYWVSDIVKPLLVSILGYFWNPIFKRMNFQFQTGFKNDTDFAKQHFKTVKSISLIESMIHFKKVPKILKFFIFTSKFWIKSIKNWYFSLSRVCLFIREN